MKKLIVIAILIVAMLMCGCNADGYEKIHLVGCDGKAVHYEITDYFQSYVAISVTLKDGRKIKCMDCVLYTGKCPICDE